MSLLQGWEEEARNWAAFARTPGHDRAHENTNLPALLDLLPPAGRRTLDLACGEGRISRLLKSMGHRVVGVDASPSMARLTAGQDSQVLVGDAARLPLADGAAIRRTRPDRPAMAAHPDVPPPARRQAGLRQPRAVPTVRTPGIVRQIWREGVNRVDPTWRDSPSYHPPRSAGLAAWCRLLLARSSGYRRV